MHIVECVLLGFAELFLSPADGCTSVRTGLRVVLHRNTALPRKPTPAE